MGTCFLLALFQKPFKIILYNFSKDGNLLKRLIVVISSFAVTAACALTLSPKSHCDQVSSHTHYEICYSNKHKQALWTFHKLELSSINGNTSRTNNFRADPNIDGPVDNTDYRGSGFDRGHLVPAGDMKLNYTSMSESFFMSNMSPQRPGFNRGIWRSLEMGLRSMVSKLGPAYIVTAPILASDLKQIYSEVSIPNYFYKIAYFPESDVMKAYLIENKTQSGFKYFEFQVTVDFIEQITGIDFFSSMEAQQQERLESQIQ